MAGVLQHTCLRRPVAPVKCRICPSYKHEKALPEPHPRPNFDCPGVDQRYRLVRLGHRAERGNTRDIP